MADQLSKQWADPVKRERLRKAQSAGAKKRWADPVKRAAAIARGHTRPLEVRRIATVNRTAAASFGLSLQQWKSMTKRERADWSWHHRRQDPTLSARRWKLDVWSERLNVSIDELKLTSGSELRDLKRKWTAKHR